MHSFFWLYLKINVPDFRLIPLDRNSDTLLYLGPPDLCPREEISTTVPSEHLQAQSFMGTQAVHCPLLKSLNASKIAIIIARFSPKLCRRDLISGRRCTIVKIEALRSLKQQLKMLIPRIGVCFHFRSRVAGYSKCGYASLIMYTCYLQPPILTWGSGGTPLNRSNSN